MKTRFLFPNKWRTAGYVLFITAFLVYVFQQYSWRLNNKAVDDFTNTYSILLNDIIVLTAIASLLLIGFSKEKIEDEQIASLRLESLQWAIYLNCLVLVVATIFINGGDYFGVLAYNIVTPLLFFIVRFKWKIFGLNRLLKEE